MSRCYVCDYSQSAGSPYNDGLQVNRSLTSNRVVYHAGMDKDICLSCLDDHMQAKNYWESIDATDYESDTPLETEADVSEYQGCTDKPTD